MCEQENLMKVAMLDGHLINVNITSSSPPEGDSKQLVQKMAITRANSAKQSHGKTTGGTCLRSQGNSRKSSTITFQEPSSVIKRPNSTIGIPTSVIPNSQSMYNSLSEKPCTKFSTASYSDSNPYNSNNSSNYNLNSNVAYQTAIETPELDLFPPDFNFNPVVREKAASLTLPDPKLHFLRKGSSNPFLTTNSGKWEGEQLEETSLNGASVSPGQYSLPAQRTSIILNGNILHSISPIAPGRPPAPGGSHQRLSIHVQDSDMRGSVNFGDTRILGSSLKPRGSTISSMTNHRSSYIGDDEHYHLHQQYLATSGRKDTIISIGKNFQIQFKSPSTSGLAWRYRTRFEKFLLFLLIAIFVVIFAYFYIPMPTDEGKCFYGEWLGRLTRSFSPFPGQT